MENFSTTSLRTNKTPNKSELRAYKQHVAQMIGEKPAIFLQQMLFLLEVKSKKTGAPIDELTVYNTAKQWSEDYFPYWSKISLRRAIKSLEDMQLLKSTQPYHGRRNRTKHYSVDIERYNELFGDAIAEIGQLRVYNIYLATLIGEKEAIFLNQLIYLAKIEKKAKKTYLAKQAAAKYGIYNTMEQWHKQFPGWSISTIKRIIRSLKSKNLIYVSNPYALRGDNTGWYAINMEEYNKLLQIEHFVEFDEACLSDDDNDLNEIRVDESQGIEDIMSTHQFKMKNTPGQNEHIYNKQKLQTETSNSSSFDFSENEVFVAEEFCFENKNSPKEERVLKKEFGLQDEIGKKEGTLSDFELFELWKKSENNHRKDENGNAIIEIEFFESWKEAYLHFNSPEFLKNMSEEEKELFLKNKNSPKEERVLKKEFGLQDEVLNEEGVREILDMLIDEWNDIHRHALKPVLMYLNSKTRPKLLKLWYGVLGQDIEKWKKFAIAANTSKFAMGEKVTKNGFKASVGWLLKEDNVIALLSGDYDVGDRKLDRDRVDENVILAEKELTVSIAKQVTDHIASNVKINKERKEFEEYVNDCMNRRNADKEDKYGMKFEFDNYRVVWMTKAKGLPLSEKEMKHIENAFYSRYLSKKHIGVIWHDVEKEVAKKIQRLKEGAESQSELLYRLKGLLNEVKCSGGKVLIG